MWAELFYEFGQSPSFIWPLWADLRPPHLVRARLLPVCDNDQRCAFNFTDNGNIPLSSPRGRFFPDFNKKYVNRPFINNSIDLGHKTLESKNSTKCSPLNDVTSLKPKRQCDLFR